tara:strand:+ start:791 stop:1144 length:354 start_codon:yes stop_codon:yes gene_type:complete
MNKIYCVSCGFKLAYELSAPKFCSSCGKNPYGIETTQESSTEVEHDSEISASRLRKLKLDIQVEEYGGHTKLDELWSNPAPREEHEQRRGFSGPSGKELLDQTVKECGTSRITDVDG